jgi:hypothetical protein
MVPVERFFNGHFVAPASLAGPRDHDYLIQYSERPSLHSFAFDDCSRRI